MSSNDAESHNVRSPGNNEPGEVPDWYRTGTRYARWALYVAAGVGVLMVLVLILLVGHPKPPG